MSKTIKQLADELGVSKTTVRNHMNEDFRAKFTEKDCKGVVLVTQEGCKVIAELCGKAENNRKESAETELFTIPRAVWEAMQDQLRVKDEQLAARDAQIADLTATVKAQAQSINADRHNELAGTMQKQLSDGSGKKKRWWKKGE